MIPPIRPTTAPIAYTSLVPGSKYELTIEVASLMPAMPFPAAAARSPERIPVRRTRVRRVLKLLNLSFRVANLSQSALRIFSCLCFVFLKHGQPQTAPVWSSPHFGLRKIVGFVFADVDIVVCLCYRRGFSGGGSYFLKRSSGLKSSTFSGTRSTFFLEGTESGICLIDS